MDDVRKEFAGGYYTLTWCLDLRDGTYVDLYCPDGKNLNVLFDMDVGSNDKRIVEGLERKIIAVEEHLNDLKKALNVLQNSCKERNK